MELVAVAVVEVVEQQPAVGELNVELEQHRAIEAVVEVEEVVVMLVEAVVGRLTVVAFVMLVVVVVGIVEILV